MHLHDAVDHWSFRFDQAVADKFWTKEPFSTVELQTLMQRLAETDVEKLSSVSAGFVELIKQSSDKTIEMLRNQLKNQLQSATPRTSSTPATKTPTQSPSLLQHSLQPQHTPHRERCLTPTREAVSRTPKDSTPNRLLFTCVTDRTCDLTLEDRPSDFGSPRFIAQEDGDERAFWMSPPAMSIFKPTTAPTPKRDTTARPATHAVTMASDTLVNGWRAQPLTDMRMSVVPLPTDLPKEHLEKLSTFGFVPKYEIARFFVPFGPLDWSEFKLDLFDGLEPKQYYDVLRNKCLSKGHSRFTIPKRGLNRAWVLFEQEKRGLPLADSNGLVAITMTATLVNKMCLLKLNMPRVTPSKRYFRKFGSSRFLQMKLNMEVRDLEEHEIDLLKAQLAEPIYFLGRKYEFLYGKDGTLYFFATEGIDIQPVSLWESIDFHVPILPNHDMTINKFYSRIALGFSNTRRTVVFEPEQIRIVDDVVDDGHVMTDGCAAISLQAMKKVSEALNDPETPCALQGRIGGAKGMWYIDHRMDLSSGIWIEIRKSQRKYDPHDDPVLRTLEVNKIAVAPAKPAALNQQFISLLESGGVEASVFVELVKENIDRVKTQVVGQEDPVRLIKWLEEVGNILKMRLDKDSNSRELLDRSLETGSDCVIDFKGDERGRELSAMSGLPNTPYEVAVELLASGFTPNTCPYLAKNLTQSLRNALASLTSKFRIEVLLSRTVFCIADPTGTLEPGEVFLQFDSSAGVDERTGRPFGVLAGDILVARNPSYLASDIFKTKAVRKNELLMYFNVVVFPVKADKSCGEGSLASRLSGGDYDGDTVFCCWDRRLTDAFTNTRILPVQQHVRDAFDVDERCLSDFVTEDRSESERKMKRIFAEIQLRDMRNELGFYNHLHTINASRMSINDDIPVYLGQMCDRLVDATKQGLILKRERFAEDKRVLSKCDKPVWLQEQIAAKQKRKGLPPTQIEVKLGADDRGVLSILYKAVKSELELIRDNDFTVAGDPSDTMDYHILAWWKLEVDRAKAMKEKDNAAYLTDLTVLRKAMVDIVGDFNVTYTRILHDADEQQQALQHTPRRRAAPIVSSNPLGDRLDVVDEEFLYRFLSTPSVDRYMSPYLRSIDRQKLPNPAAEYELRLKACALYIASWEKRAAGKCCWTLAFRTLCNIKSSMVSADGMRMAPLGGPRTVIDSVWNTFKIDVA